MVQERVNLTNVDILLDGELVGGAEELSATITPTNEFAHEGGSPEPVEIVGGKKEYNGSLTKAWTNSDFIKKLAPYGEGIPYFNLQGIVKNKYPARTIKVENAKLDSIDISSLSMDGYARNVIPFKALAVKPD